MLVACGDNTKSVTPQKTVKKQTVIKKVYSNSTLPAWVLNPDLDGNIGTVAIINTNKIKNIKKQQYIAKKICIANLQKRKSAMINSSVVKIKKKKNGIVKTDIKKEIKIEASHFQVENIVKKAEYRKENSYYVWMVISK
jgi:aminopeptidase C